MIGKFHLGGGFVPPSNRTKSGRVRSGGDSMDSGDSGYDEYDEEYRYFMQCIQHSGFV